MGIFSSSELNKANETIENLRKNNITLRTQVEENRISLHVSRYSMNFFLKELISNCSWYATIITNRLLLVEELDLKMLRNILNEVKKIMSSYETKINESKNECKCRIQDYPDLAFIKYVENGKVLKTIQTITLRYKQPSFIRIIGQTELSGGLESTPYSVELVYNDHTTKDITFSPNLILDIENKDLGLFYENIIIPNIEHSPFNIILHASYEDEDCSNKKLSTSLNVYIHPFNLVKTTLNGPDSIRTNKFELYSTNAYYSNGWIYKNVNAKYSISKLNGDIIEPDSFESPVSLSFEVDEPNEKILRIDAKKTLVDKSIILSSYYEEPYYEKTENSLISKEILIKGGFEISLTGNIMLYNETKDEIDFVPFNSKSSVKINSVNDFTFNDDFIIENYIPSSNLKFTNINELNTSGIEYHLIDVTDENGKTIKLNYDGSIFSSIKSESKTLKKNSKYRIRFYDILKSKNIEDCAYDLNGLSIHNDVICSYAKFNIDNEFNDSYVLGLSNLYFENDFTVLYPVSKFETITGIEYTNEFMLNHENDMWLVKGPPLKATKLKDILIAFAFKDNEI